MSAQARSHADGPVRSRVLSGGANVLWTGTISSRRGVKGVAEWRIREQEERKKQNGVVDEARRGGEELRPNRRQRVARHNGTRQNESLPQGRERQ